jgi:hypothetical protein
VVCWWGYSASSAKVAKGPGKSCLLICVVLLVCFMSFGSPWAPGKGADQHSFVVTAYSHWRGLQTMHGIQVTLQISHTTRTRRRRSVCPATTRVTHPTCPSHTRWGARALPRSCVQRTPLEPSTSPRPPAVSHGEVQLSFPCSTTIGILLPARKPYAPSLLENPT